MTNTRTRRSPKRRGSSAPDVRRRARDLERELLATAAEISKLFDLVAQGRRSFTAAALIAGPAISELGYAAMLLDAVEHRYGPAH